MLVTPVLLVGVGLGAGAGVGPGEAEGEEGSTVSAVLPAVLSGGSFGLGFVSRSALKLCTEQSRMVKTELQHDIAALSHGIH